MPHHYLYACAVTSMPAPDSPWTWSRAFADLVRPLFGRGAILPPGPSPTNMPYKYPRATLSGLGPPHKIAPRPDIGHTKAKTQSHRGQTPPAPPGPGPASFWTWCHFSPWTWSNHHALQVPQSHTQWTWSTTQSRTSARYRPHQGQNTVTPRPNTPWTWSTTHKQNLFNNHIIKQLIEHAYEKNRSSHTPLRRTSQCPALSHKHEGP